MNGLYNRFHFLLLSVLLSLLLGTSACKDREIPHSANGQPLPFDHQLATPPSGLQPAPSPSAGTTAAAGTSVRVRVSLSPALAGRAGPNDTVFIFARAAQGPKMPLAVTRRQVRELPLTLSLDDSMAMVAGMNLSSAAMIIVGARVSKSGDPLPAAGDLEGFSAPFRAGSEKPVEVKIAAPVGGRNTP